MTPPRGSSMTTWHYRCEPELLIPTAIDARSPARTCRSFLSTCPTRILRISQLRWCERVLAVGSDSDKSGNPRSSQIKWTVPALPGPTLLPCRATGDCRIIVTTKGNSMPDAQIAQNQSTSGNGPPTHPTGRYYARRGHKDGGRKSARDSIESR